MKDMKVSRIRYLDGVRIDGPNDYWCEMMKHEAIQLAKDLLMACGENCVISSDLIMIQTVSEPGDMLAGVYGPKTASEDADDPPVYSGMSLDEIQEWVKEIQGRYNGPNDTGILATLIADLSTKVANLAARVKEIKEPTQVVITHGEGVLAKCSNCGYEGGI